MKTVYSDRSGGFSLVELLLIVAVVGTITSMSYVSITNSRVTAENVKLENDVASVNRSIQLYLANGGSLSDAASLTEADVVARLQRIADAGTSSKTMGLKSNFLDRRVRTQPETRADSQIARAIWNSSANPPRFDVAYANSGVRFRFVDDNEDVTAAASEARTTTKDSQDGGWVWEYSDTTSLASNSGASPGINVTPPAGLVGAPDLPFTNSWTITDPNGRVDVSDVYREADYQSRVALVSLEGMEGYDLTTTAGRLAFMRELVRRAAQGDRAQTIIDRSRNSSGNGAQNYNETFYFRPGDTVAAVIIPNGSFQNTYDQMLSGTTTTQTFPLTTLNLGTDQPPFYANQVASLGNNGFGLEDLVANGNSDLDFDDIIFTASGLGEAENSTTREIDPRTYYTQRLAQLGRSNQWPALEAALIAKGIITPN